ncbi:hypothetical protein [Asanoa iriomotensis]|nr:hypothetical protein [Asanoa iriomotensis]
MKTCVSPGAARQKNPPYPSGRPLVAGLPIGTGRVDPKTSEAMIR